MSIQVSVRVRPIIPRIDGRRGEVLQYDETENAVQLVSDVPNPGQLKSYRFDNLLGPERSTGQLYDELVRGDVQRLQLGYNLALFTYGPSGAGKTHTMTGDARSPGITTLAFRQIFAQRSPDERCGTVRVSVMEIYQDVVCDLLNRRAKVQLKGSGAGGVLRFQGLGEQQVHSADEAVRTVEAGLAARTKAATYVHEHSNRSHTVVRVLLESTRESTAGGDEVLLASLILVDLAGSETVSDQQTQTAQSEGKSITRSLFHLRRCIHALAAGRRPEYRSSKLTRLLEPSIAQGSITIICNVGQRVLNQRQTADCLDFGKQAAMVQLAPPKRNVAKATSTTAEIRSLQTELHVSRSNQATLEAELRELRSKLSERDGHRREASEEQLQQLQDKLRQEMAAKAQANELLRAAEEQNQSLHSQLLGLEEALSTSQGSMSATADLHDWTAASTPSSVSTGNDSRTGVRAHSSATDQVAGLQPCAAPDTHSAKSTRSYPTSPSGPSDARRVFGDAQSAERSGHMQNALDLYQHGLRLLMKHVKNIPPDQAALQPHVQVFFDRAFAVREQLKQQRSEYGREQSGDMDATVMPASSNVDVRGACDDQANDTHTTTPKPIGSSYFADALLMQAQSAEDSGEYKLALALLQEGIRATLAALKAHPDQQQVLNCTLESLFQRAYAVRQLAAAAGHAQTPEVQAPRARVSVARIHQVPSTFSELVQSSSWCLCRALYTFRPTYPGDDDLPLAAGDLIAVQGDATTEWIHGKRVISLGAGVLQVATGGAFPSKCVEQCCFETRCVADFESEEPDELDLRRGYGSHLSRTRVSHAQLPHA
jgi:hypothetical protein